MKTNPYVAIHQSKALFIRIPSPRFFFIFIKGLLYKIHIKFTAFSDHFICKGLYFYQIFGFSCIAFGKFQGRIRNQRQLAMQKTFQKKWSPKCLNWWILGVLITLKVFCMKVSAMETDGAFTFPSVWVSGAAHLESSRHTTGDVFCMYSLIDTVLAYFSFLENVDKT